jgi:YgiT-type zinc finger domain-containing protein
VKCPCCGGAELVRDTRDQTYTYKGETTVIPAVTTDYCPACDESITDMGETERVMREISIFSKAVDAGNVIDHQEVQAWADNLSTDVEAMTVSELIEHLHRFPQDMPVFVQGYETGWDRIHALREAPVLPFKKAQEWDGEYKEANEFRNPGEPFSAVLIEGRRGARR